MMRKLLLSIKVGVLLILLLTLLVGVGNVNGINKYSVASGGWGSPSTWSNTSGGAGGAAVPLAGDAVFIEGGYNVAVSSSTNDLLSLTISTGSRLTISTNNRTVTATTITVNGTIYRSQTALITGTITFNSGSIYQHDLDGGTIPTATWNANSNCNITGVSNTAPGGVNQTFGHFTWNCAQTGWVSIAPTSMAIQGNLTIANTGPTWDWAIEQNITVNGDLIITGGVYRICYGSNRIQTIKGNVSITGGKLAMNTNPTAFNGTLNVAGNFTHSAGTIDETGSGNSTIIFNGTTPQTYTSGGTVTNTINFTVNNGATLQMAAPGTTITGGGTFVLAAGATLGVTSPNGIVSAVGTMSGNIQTTAGRTFTAGANYIYNGNAAQVTGTGLTQNTPANITINNSAGVSLSAATTISGLLTMTSGTLDMADFALTMGSLTGSNNLTNSTGGITAQTITIGSDNSSTAYSGVISNGTNTGGVSVTKNGTGVLTLSGVNTYTGATTVSAGTLKAGVATTGATGAFGNGSAINLTNISGAILDLAGFNNTIGSLAGGGPLGGNVTLGAATLTVGNATNTTYSGIISGTGGITKNGTSTLTLSGANTYTGSTTINAGTLTLGASGVIADAGSVSLSGGTLRTGAAAGFTETVGTVNLSANSTIALGTGVHTLTFANSSGITWAGTTLTITGWTGTAGATGTAGKIFFGVGGLTSAQLAKISFTGYPGVPVLLPTGELVPPGQILVIAGTLSHGSSCVGFSAAPITYTITNNGANASGVTVTSDNSQFVVSGAPVTVTGNGGTTTFTVVFTPSSSGAKSATITVASTSTGSNSPTISLSGTGNALPAAPIVGIITQPTCATATATVALSGLPAAPWTVTASTGSATITGSTTTANFSGLTANTNYTFTVTLTSTGCTSSASGTAAINAQPVSPSITLTSSGAICGPGPVTISATASSGTINWYSALTGGSLIGTGNTYTTPGLSASATYYVDATNGTCTSSPRIAVQAVIITPPTILASGGGTFCTGTNVSLSITNTNLTNQYWTGPNSFYSLLQNPTVSAVTIAATGIYTVTGSALSGINLVSNGDFEAGNTGFGSSYGYVAPGANVLTPEGLYTIVANPNSVHNGFTGCSDHTIGGGTPTGLQMVINGAVTAGASVWSQSVNVVPSTNYQFTYWVQSVVGNNPSQLQLLINGLPVGPTYTAITATCQFAQFTYNWNSGASTTANLSLVNQDIVAGGNDFTLDDLVFQQACEVTSSVVVTVNAAVSAGAIGIAQTICSGNTPAAITSTTNGTGDGTITYEWQSNASGTYVTIGGASSATFPPPALTSTTSYQRRTVSVSGGTTCYSPYTTAVTITVAGPTAIAGGPDTVCESATPTPITLSGTSFGGTASTAAWSIISGGGTLSSTAQTATPSAVTYTPAANFSGIVTLSLTTNIAGGCAAVSDRTINITALPTANAGSALSAICKGGTSAALGGSVGGSATGGTWSDGAVGGTFTPNATTLNATWTPPAAYTGTATLTLTTTGGSCTAATATKTQLVDALPTANAGSVLSAICKGGTSAALGGSVGGSATGGTWSDGAVGGTFTPNATTLNATWTPPAAYTGTATLTLTTTGGSCTAATATYTVIVNPLTGTPNFTSGATTICQDDPDETYSATAANSTAISYSVLPVAAGIIDSGTGVMNWSPTFFGTATITATATGTCETSSADRSVTVNPKPIVGTFE